MIEWINLSSLFVSIFLFCYLYILSIQPIKRENKKGEQTWKQSMFLRFVSGVMEFIIILNMILWLWFPIPFLIWKINANFFIGIIIGIIITIPCSIIMVKGIKDAGSESLKPSKDTQMYGGIYRYIRHPQSLGEFPLFIAIAFLVNSWFLVYLMTIFVLIYVPIMIHFEEIDLVKRFGDSYCEYQQKTGALIPKIRKRK